MGRRPEGVLILGVPGAGKSTLASTLAKMVDGAHFAASNVLRAYARTQPVRVADWQRYWSRGENAPDDEVLPVLWDAFTRADREIVLLDGYPRTRSQLLDFRARGGELCRCVVLEAETEVAVRRVLRRIEPDRSERLSRASVLRRIHRERAQIHELTSAAGIGNSLIQYDSGRMPVHDIARAVVGLLNGGAQV